MQIQSIQNSTQSFGAKIIKRPIHPNRIIKKAKTPKPKTVVVWPDGTIGTGFFAKLEEKFDIAAEKILELLV